MIYPSPDPKNIRAGEAAPIESRRSPARATNAGRATTPVPEASCRPSSSSRSLPPDRGLTTRTVLYHTLLKRDFSSTREFISLLCSTLGDQGSEKGANPRRPNLALI